MLNRTNKRRRTPTERTTNRTMHEQNDARTLPVSSRLVSSFVRWCSALPPPRAPPRSWPLPPSRCFQKGLEEGAFLPLSRVTSRIRQSGEDVSPLPLSHSVRRGEEDSGRSYLGGSFGREFLGGRCSYAPFVAATPAPSIRPAEIVTARCMLRMASCEDGGGVVVKRGVVMGMA